MTGPIARVIARREADLRRLFGNQLSGPTDPASDAGWGRPGNERPASGRGERAEPTRKGFFTDTSICIGCKACEVACKEWNRVPPRANEVDGARAEHGRGVPGTQAPGGGPAHGHDAPGVHAFGSSYDNTGHLGPDTWRHVAFIEQGPDQLAAARASGRRLLTITPVSHADSMTADAPGVTLFPTTGTKSHLEDDGASTDPCSASSAAWASTGSAAGGAAAVAGEPGASDLPPVRWLMSSDVCKHCTHAACLDVCPTGALFRTEFGTVVVQDDVCNGCGYCVAACPFGVIGRRRSGTVTIAGSTEPIKNGGVAQKCTLCYDRIGAGLQPACAKTCPTTSITFGDHDDMVSRARERLAELHAQGRTEARLYGANPDDGVGGTGSIFLLLDEPEVYGLPPDPVVTTKALPAMFLHAGIAGTLMMGVVSAAFVGAAGGLLGSGALGRNPGRPALRASRGGRR